MSGIAPFIGVSLLIILTPGQDTILTVRNTLSGGRIGGVLTAIGVATGQLTWTIAANAGLGAILLANPLAYSSIKFAGAAYLVWLGVQSLRAVCREEASLVPYAPVATAPAAGGFLRQGFISNLTNPKMLLFFSSLLPQFADGGGVGRIATLGIIFCVLTLAWLTCYAVTVRALGRFFSRMVAQAIEGVAGVALLVLGLNVAAEAAKL